MARVPLGARWDRRRRLQRGARVWAGESWDRIVLAALERGRQGLEVAAVAVVPVVGEAGAVAQMASLLW